MKAILRKFMEWRYFAALDKEVGSESLLDSEFLIKLMQEKK